MRAACAFDRLRCSNSTGPKTRNEGLSCSRCDLFATAVYKQRITKFQPDLTDTVNNRRFLPPDGQHRQVKSAAKVNFFQSAINEMRLFG